MMKFETTMKLLNVAIAFMLSFLAIFVITVLGLLLYDFSFVFRPLSIEELEGVRSFKNAMVYFIYGFLHIIILIFVIAVPFLFYRIIKR